MRITYKNTFLDILRFNMAHQFSSFGYQAMILLPCAFIYYAESTDHTGKESLVIVTGWYVGAWALQLLLTAFLLGTKRGPNDKTEHTLEIQAEALCEETKFNRSYHFWSGPIRHVRRGGLTAIYVTPMLAHVVPNRAFQSKLEQDQFIALVQQKVNSRRHSP